MTGILTGALTYSKRGMWQMAADSEWTATLPSLPPWDSYLHEGPLALTSDSLGEQLGKDLLVNRPQCVTLGLRAFKQICNETEFDWLPGDSTRRVFESCGNGP